MAIDLHTHSAISDGTAAPADLVAAARAAGLAVLALTDHDTTDGWAAAQRAADRLGVELVPGIEFSTRYGTASVHLLAYWPDPHHPALAEELAKVRQARRDRLDTLVARLTEAGAPITRDDVLAQAAGASSIGRPHVADALVAAGHVPDRMAAFDRLLGPGRSGNVPKYAPATVDAIRLVRAAGGVPVLAHPWGRGRRTLLDPSVLAAFAAAGLAGLEVDHLDHDTATRAELRALAAELDLVVTGGSDHHGTGKVNHPLGVATTGADHYARLQAGARDLAVGHAS